MSGPINIQSSSEWQGILSSTNVVIADFYADWCGPCKAIAPHFEKLAQEHSRPKKVAFCKINVDTQSSISRALGVTAMPTFIIFHAGQPVETIRGANPPALTAAITKAIALPDKANAGSAFQKPGRTLGGEGVGSQTTAPARGGAGSGLGFGFMDVLKHIIPILGIYFVSLFAIDSYTQARLSSFNVVSPPPPPPARNASGAAGGKSRAAARPSQFKTLADLGKDE
ncbi:thioredoxin [Plectosphaerella cucumerina]|uniref:Thioredoxin n=1 Tax=Plectosphaerella cucumerina TaxID=40658 RepID=A0A8K0X9Z6_9PEZI|nr:thioredoxin [Plectosphaerella cucumerina]